MAKQLSAIQRLIIRNEGFSSRVYQCTANKPTIGYGTNLHDRGLTEDEALHLLNNDLKTIRMRMKAEGLTGFMTDSQEAVIYDMAYNLGWAGLLEFKRMIFAIKCGEYEEAAKELLDSKYARDDVPHRAKRNAALLSGEVEL